MWFTIGFAGACALGAYFDIRYWLPPLAAILVFGAVGMWYLIQWRENFRIGAVILLGCAVGILWFWGYDTLYLSDARQLDGETVTAHVEINDYSWHTSYGSAADGTIILDGKKYQVRVYLNKTVDLVPGDRVQSDFRLYTTTGESRDPTYHRGEGIFLLAYQTGEALYNYSEYLEWGDLPAYLRLRLTNMIQQTFPEDTAAFGKALLLGDDTDIDYETDTALKISGIRHIIAVSGLHVTILFSLIYNLTGKKRFLTAIVGIPLLLLFAAVVGFTPSVTRACVMQILMILALLFKRDYDPPTALAFAALMMLIINPIVIVSISFQLSVCCMIGIFLFSERIKAWILHEKRLGRFKGKNIKVKLSRWFASSVSVTLSATIVTTPLCAYYFGAVSLVGILTNMLTLWVITFLFYGIMLVCGLGILWLSGGQLAATVISWGIRYVIWIAKGLTKFPLAAVYTRSEYIVWWLVLCYLLIIGCSIFKIRQPVILGCCIAISLFAALIPSWIAPLTGECRLTVLDVGQGQCILFQSEGKNYMVDCGGTYDDDTADAAAETLLTQGISRLDGIIVTHYDRDHVGAMENLLTRISADQLYLPDTENTDGLKEGIIARFDGEMISVSNDMMLSWGNAKITIFAPLAGKTGNESSMCVLFQTENCDILITGDNNREGELLLLERTVLPKLEVLIVGHHGSKYSTCYELLEATQPDTAIISVDAKNSYGHPSPEVINRLTEFGCEIYRTDLNGTVIYKG